MMLEPTVSSSIECALRTLRYGSIQLVVHDGQVVRIERVERVRLPAAAAAQTGLTGAPGSLQSPTGHPTTQTEGCHETDQ